jgi:hypothetical protein
MYSLGSQNPIRAAPLRVIPEGLYAHSKARLLKSSFDQSGMELADDLWRRCAGLPKDAIPGQDLIVIGQDIVRTEGSQLAQHRFWGAGRLVHQRRAVAAARLPGGLDTLPTTRLETLRQEVGQTGEATHRKAEIDLLPGQSIKVGRLAGFSSPLADHQVSERDKALEVSMGDRAVHAGSFGRIIDRPFGLVHIEVEQDPPAGPILKRADRTVDLACLILAHSASLSVHGQMAYAPKARIVTPPRVSAIAPPRTLVMGWCRTRVDSRTVITMYELDAAAATETGRLRRPRK